MLVSLSLKPQKTQEFVCGSVARENCFKHQLPNPGLLHRGHDLFKMLSNVNGEPKLKLAALA